jgi:hypothetical protein
MHGSGLDSRSRHFRRIDEMVVVLVGLTVILPKPKIAALMRETELRLSANAAAAIIITRVQSFPAAATHAPAACSLSLFPAQASFGDPPSPCFQQQRVPRVLNGMISSISWVPKGASKNVPVVAEPPTQEEIDEAIKAIAGRE